MQCPVDGTTLVMSDRQGVEIDYCPQCRGVWLDRGELDKIIERSVPAAAPAQSAPAYAQDRSQGDDQRGYEKKKRRGSFLDDIFDF
jgi:Zn-finger nucleic acid-binding protein